MKNSKKLKLILQILICILIILIGIVGIYTKSGNLYKNLFPHTYTLGSDINGTTVIEFSPDDTVEKIYYDKDGNEVESSKITEENKKDYEVKEIPVNAEENLNANNYNTSLDIMKKRLDFFNMQQYQLNVDEKTGIISLSVDDEHFEDKISFVSIEGSLQLIDSKTGDIIIDHTNFKSAESTYASLTTEYRTYISLKLNNSGIEKINGIDKYNSSGDGTIILKFDNEEVAKISYEDILLTGKTLRITTATGLKSDADINSQINMDIIISKIATIGKMPVIYTLTGEEFVRNDLGNVINYIVISFIVVIAIISVVLVIKYRFKGLLAVLGLGACVSVLLIKIRLTNIQISLNGLAGMYGLITLNMLLINNILKCIKNKDKVFSENIKDAYLKTVDAIVIMLVIFIVFAFSSMTLINTIGLVLFWGWLVTVFGNLIFTVPMLSIVTNK